MSRRVQGRLRPLSRAEREKKFLRNIRRGRPKFRFFEGKRYGIPNSIPSLIEIDGAVVAQKVKTTMPNGRSAVLENKDF